MQLRRDNNIIITTNLQSFPVSRGLRQWKLPVVGLLLLITQVISQDVQPDNPSQTQTTRHHYPNVCVRMPQKRLSPSDCAGSVTHGDKRPWCRRQKREVTTLENKRWAVLCVFGCHLKVGCSTLGTRQNAHGIQGTELFQQLMSTYCA